MPSGATQLMVTEERIREEVQFRLKVRLRGGDGTVSVEYAWFHDTLQNLDRGSRIMIDLVLDLISSLVLSSQVMLAPS